MTPGLIVVVRGIGDIGSAVAHKLFTAGYRVMIAEDPLPAAPRRGMSFTDAAFDGSAVLEGVTATTFQNPSRLAKALQVRREIPVYLDELGDMLTYLDPSVLVDARMRKHSEPERQIHLAPFTIGLGPGFEAGVTTHVAIETQWGEDLGKVITSGKTQALAGEPRDYGGQSRERFIYAPSTGIFGTDHRIGDMVELGEVVAYIGETPLLAPMAGILRGLVHDCVPVSGGEKVVEVDPRGDPAGVVGIGERPGRIAEGVLEAIANRAARS